ncbi:MAG: methyltransferase domain-containing protein [Acidobacteria bacterium]|nr:methyltransferase domain-containing protein [Acidobacteriota bacterium]
MQLPMPSLRLHPGRGPRRRLLTVVAVLAVGWGAAGVSAQSPPGQLVPEIGREGKDVVWVPSPDPLVDTMLAIADVSKRDVVMDLGSGDGRMVIAAALLGARAIGVEFDPELVELSRATAAAAGVAERTTFVNADLFETDLSPATVITMFLLPELNSRLRPRLLELEPGTRIVSNTWDLEDWAADATEVLDPCPGFCTALLWIVPARVAGTWELADGELVLEQQFQMVSGTLRSGSEEVPIADGRLRGDELSFRASGAVYTGRVRGSRLAGEADDGARRFGWHALRVAAQ